MTDMKWLEFAELPLAIARQLQADDFIQACASPFRDSIVCWVRGENPRWQNEREFVRDTGQELRGEERLRGLPEGLSFPVGDQWAAVRSFSLHEPSNCLTEDFEIYASDGFVKVADAGQFIFGYKPETPEALCLQAIETAAFPHKYATWPVTDKINFWVAQLYRVRRHTAEDGGTEDGVFGPDLIQKMALIDPQIRRLFATIIQALAVMEGEDPARLLQVALQKTGLAKQ